jgi:putative transposase
MCPYYQNRFLIGSKRYRGYDYSSEGCYYITINTKNKNQSFGRIENGTVILSEIGEYLYNEWLRTPLVRPDMNITLDACVVMPDHFHAIIYIGPNTFNAAHDSYINEFGPQSKNLSSIVRGVKSAVTSYARKMNICFDWHKGYYDHIIRTRIELNRIREYIISNPAKWTEKQ